MGALIGQSPINKESPVVAKGTIALPDRVINKGYVLVGDGTVPSGGRFDGIAGIATGLEAVRALKDAGVRLDHAIEVIDFFAEGPSEYGLSCVGSRGIVGSLDGKRLDLTGAGQKSRDAFRCCGRDPSGAQGSRSVRGGAAESSDESKSGAR